MLKLLILVAATSLAMASFGDNQIRHYERFGDLVVTATSVTSAKARDEDQRYVAVFVRIRNEGRDAACASFSAKLKATDDHEYTEVAGLPPDFHWPDPPHVWQMLPGGESEGAYVFELKSGVDPAELLVKLDSASIRCGAGQIGDESDALFPQKVELDVHDLPEPNSVDKSSIGNGSLPNAGSHGYSYPLCLYCPRAAYSEEAKRAGVEGTVRLVATITPDGYAIDIHVAKGLGYGLDSNSVEAVRTWRFKPALGPDGKPAAVRLLIELTFQ